MGETVYPISEAAKLAGVESHVLRYWEEELKLPIGRNGMGHRYYTEQDIQIFLAIKELKKRGFQLKMIRAMIPKMEEELHTSEQPQKYKLKGTSEVKTKIPDKQQRAVSAEKEAAATVMVKTEVKKDKAQKVDKLKVEVVKPEVKKVEASKVEAPKVEPPKTEPSKVQSQKTELLKAGQLKAEPSKVEPQKVGSQSPKSQKTKIEKAKIEKTRIQKIPVRDIKKEKEDKSRKDERQQEFYRIMERLLKQLSVEKHSEERYKRLDAAIRKHQYSRRMVAATEEQGKKRKKK